MSKYLEESYDALLKENSEIIEQNKKLLQRLEIAQKALQEITYSENVAAMNAIAEEALDQLKE